MRVALVHSRYDTAEPSGENAVVNNEVAALERAGVEVRLFERASDDLRAEPLRRTRAAMRVATGRGQSPLDDLRSWRPDVVHVHNLFPNFGTSWLQDIEVPVVATVHNFRAVCAAGILFRDGHPCTDCVDSTRISGLLHRCYRGSAAATLPLTLSQRRPLHRDRVLGRADCVIVLAEHTRDLYVRMGLDPEKVRVWPHFLPDRDRPEPSSCSDVGGFHLFLGRVSDQKGIVELAERWPSGFRLLVIGDGPEAARLSLSARGRDVEVRAAIPRSEVMALIRSARSVVVPSRGPEQFGLVYLEALAAGTPVVAFNTSGVSERVNRDGTGVVCRWEADIAPALLQAEERRLEFRRAAADAMAESYSESAYLRRAVDLYSELVSTTR